MEVRRRRKDWIYLFLIIIWKGNSLEMCNISCKNMRSFMRGMYY